MSNYDINNVKKKIYFKKNGFDFTLSSRNFEMTRNITYNDGYNSVYHAYLRVPERVQGKGLTRKMFQILYKQYEAGNVKKINVTANINIGGYAWAKYGFSALNKDEVLDIVNSSSNSLFKKSARRKIKYFYSKYGDNRAFPMHRLAKLKGGKDALLNSFWSGVIDLNDRGQLKRFLNYLFK